MRGKTVVITGGTSGIGEVAAVTLARMGARIVLIARDKIRADATLARLREYTPGIAHTAHFADLLRLAEMKRVAAQVAEHEPRIDVLINGIGEVAALTLARMGARIVLIARDKIRSDAILARLREYAPGIAHTVHFADLLRARAALSLGSRAHH
jgi:short-subunit dehydrogenase